MTPFLKTIEYRGGVVSFEIPTHWEEEYEPKGGGTFYEDRPDSGTLRLNILSFESKAGLSSEELLREDAMESGEVLACGFPLKRYMLEEEESGEALHFYRWEVSVPVPPSGSRLACFCYTIVAGQESDSRIKEELALVDQIVRAARFAVGQGVIGTYHHAQKKEPNQTPEPTPPERGAAHL